MSLNRSAKIRYRDTGDAVGVITSDTGIAKKSGQQMLPSPHVRGNSHARSNQTKKYRAASKYPAPAPPFVCC